MVIRRRAPALGLVLLAALWQSETLAQTGANVLLVVNDNSPESLRIGEYYRNKRGVPEANEVRVSTAVAEEISREAYEADIEAPIAGALARERLQDRVVYIVLTRGVPIRISGTRGRDGTIASVDSELALLYRKMVRGPYSLRGPLPNPFFLPDGEPAYTRRFDRARDDIYLVTRLDGFTVEDAVALVDRAAAPVASGRFVFRTRQIAAMTAVQQKGNGWLEAAAARLRAMDGGLQVLLIPEKETPPVGEAILGYYSWGATDPALHQRPSGLALAAGSIGALFAGAAGRTLREPPPTWSPGSLAYAGTADPLLADLARDGLTGVAGHVSEGYLDGMVRPDILFPAYAAGLTLGEAFYRATPSLSWQSVVLGDPLCAPFASASSTRLWPQSPVDPHTELPAQYSRRRLEAMSATGVQESALKLFLRAESTYAREDRAGAIEALREALQIAPRFYLAALRVAVLMEQAGDRGAADAYRRVLEMRPTDPIALNNLALLVAADGKLDEALALAQKASAAAPRSPEVSDTLGWIHHLRGDDPEAARLLEQAVSGAPRNAEIRLHAAVVFFEGGERVRAKRELDAALSLDPALQDHPDARRLLDQLR